MKKFFKSATAALALGRNVESPPSLDPNSNAVVDAYSRPLYPNNNAVVDAYSRPLDPTSEAVVNQNLHDTFPLGFDADHAFGTDSYKGDPYRGYSWEHKKNGKPNTDYYDPSQEKIYAAEKYAEQKAALRDKYKDVVDYNVADTLDNTWLYEPGPNNYNPNKDYFDKLLEEKEKSLENKTGGRRSTRKKQFSHKKGRHLHRKTKRRHTKRRDIKRRRTKK
jgi:hypothetical protein